jgi:magnesium transporter
MQQSRVYVDGILVDADVTLGNLKNFKRKRKTAIWVDLVDPTTADLEHLGEELGLHPLAIEDALAGRQRAKLEHYPTHLFLNAYAAKWDSVADELHTYEISAFVTPYALITVRDKDNFDISEVTKRWDDAGELAQNGVAFLLWGLIDLLVDEYFVLVEKLDVEVDELEDLLFEEDNTKANANAREIQKRSYKLRKALVTLRRVAVPMREIVNPIVRNDAPIIGGDMLAYYQDIYDHVMRVADWIDSLRDLVTTLLETNLTMQGNRMNLIMKKVTSWAAIIAVPTAVTGFYGQNVPYPGFGNASGFWESIVLMVGGSAGLYWAFRRNDWL